MLQCFARMSVVCNICIVDKWCIFTEKLPEEVNRKRPMANDVNDDVA